MTGASMPRTQPARSPSSCTITSSRPHCATPRRPCCPISSRVTHSCSGSTPEHAGYWQANGEGVENFTRAEWALALDELGGHSEDSFRRTADRLEQRGDAALAFRVAELGLARYPNSVALLRSRARADHAQSDQLADESVSVHRLLRVVGQSARACFAAIAANSCPRRTSGHRRTPQLRAGLRRSAIRISAGRVCFRVAANGEVPNEKSPSGDGSSPARPGRQIAVAEDISWPEAERLDQGSGPH